MTEHHLTEGNIAKAAEALAKDEYHNLNEDIKTHLAECDLCAHEVQAVSQWYESNHLTLHQPARQRIRSMAIGVAASIILVVVGVQLFQRNKPSRPTLSTNELKTDSLVQGEEITKTPEAPVAYNAPEESTPDTTESSSIQEIAKDQNLLAYQEHEELEALVKRFEDSALRGEGVKVLSASTIEERASDISLCWENPEQEELIIEFFSNQGDKLFEVYSDANSYHPEALTTPGLYYWKMLNAEFDLIFCGRIKIIQ